MHSSHGLALAQPGVRSWQCFTASARVLVLVVFPLPPLFGPQPPLLPAPQQPAFELQSQGRALVVPAKRHNACKACEGQAPYMEVAGEPNP
jgi:hypothetical protein